MSLFYKIFRLGKTRTFGGGLHSQAISDYNKTRNVWNQQFLCHAPFNSMYFNVHGEVGPCWLNLMEMGRYPQQSIREIWFGEAFSELRKAIRKDDLSYRCGTCMQNMKQGNHVSVLAKLYDHPHPITDHPSVMEFELSNRCNLECVMCKGELSSTIRKNREKLPPLNEVYDAQFVVQLEEFIPHLHEAKFLGGEPFLIDIYYDIWERIAAIRPEMAITVTTNASVFNNRVRTLLETLNFNIIVSIDSFQKETYESIRHRGNFETVIGNFHLFREFTRSKGSYMQVSMNPLRLNWREMAAAVEFVNEQDVALWFNTVIYPHDQALWTLGAAALEEVYQSLSSRPIGPKPQGCSKITYDNNVRNYHNLVENQIRNWWLKAKEAEDLRSSEVEHLSGPQIKQRLWADVTTYLTDDAYLSQHVRNLELKKLEAAFNQRTRQIQMVELKQLYRMPISSLMAVLRDARPQEEKGDERDV